MKSSKERTVFILSGHTMDQPHVSKFTFIILFNLKRKLVKNEKPEAQSPYLFSPKLYC